MVDVQKLRSAAAARAAARPAATFDGLVVDDTVDEIGVRRYLPAGPGRESPPVVFLHGGYGIFGDLNLQDGYCRQLAAGLGQWVVSIDYPLAPEHSFDESVGAVVAVIHQLGGADPVTLCGDSAGGAVAIGAAKRLGPVAAALLLTNPNLDFTLATFDAARTGGPDLEISQAAFASWHRTDSLALAPRLHMDAGGLPPTVIAVGTDDSLAPEANDLADSLRRRRRPCQLVDVPGAGHGFMGDPASAGPVIVRFRSFLDHHTQPVAGRT